MGVPLSRAGMRSCQGDLTLVETYFRSTIAKVCMEKMHWICFRLLKITFSGRIWCKIFLAKIPYTRVKTPYTLPTLRLLLFQMFVLIPSSRTIHCHPLLAISRGREWRPFKTLPPTFNNGCDNALNIIKVVPDTFILLYYMVNMLHVMVVLWCFNDGIK